MTVEGTRGFSRIEKAGKKGGKKKAGSPAEAQEGTSGHRGKEEYVGVRKTTGPSKTHEKKKQGNMFLCEKATSPKEKKGGNIDRLQRANAPWRVMGDPRFEDLRAFGKKKQKTGAR